MDTQRKCIVINEVAKRWTHRENVLLLMRLSSHGHRKCFVTNEVVKPWTHRKKCFVIIFFWVDVAWIWTCFLHKKLHVRTPVFFVLFLFLFFFYHGFLSRILTTHRRAGEGREGTIFYSTLPLLPAHEHSDIYLQLCMWDDYHIFLITPLLFTRLLLDVIYHLIELPFDWLMTWS